jgi:hypothetical protein
MLLLAFSSELTIPMAQTDLRYESNSECAYLHLKQLVPESVIRAPNRSRCVNPVRPALTNKTQPNHKCEKQQYQDRGNMRDILVRAAKPLSVI